MHTYMVLRFGVKDSHVRCFSDSIWLKGKTGCPPHLWWVRGEVGDCGRRPVQCVPYFGQALRPGEGTPPASPGHRRTTLVVPPGGPVAEGAVLAVSLGPLSLASNPRPLHQLLLSPNALLRLYLHLLHRLFPKKSLTDHLRRVKQEVVHRLLGGVAQREKGGRLRLNIGKSNGTRKSRSGRRDSRSRRHRPSD